MAFSKMVGFEVTPRRSSSSIFFRRSPVVSIARRMLSYQMDWPSFMISTSRLLINTLLKRGENKGADVLKVMFLRGEGLHFGRRRAGRRGPAVSLSNDAVTSWRDTIT